LIKLFLAVSYERVLSRKDDQKWLELPVLYFSIVLLIFESLIFSLLVVEVALLSSVRKVKMIRLRIWLFFDLSWNALLICTD